MENINIQEIKFKKDESNEEKYVMIQIFAITQRGPEILSKIFKGIEKIDGNEVGRLLEEKSNIILLDKNKQIDDKILKLTEIIKNYGYEEVKIDIVFNLMANPK